MFCAKCKQPRPRSACTYVQADLGLCSLHSDYTNLQNLKSKMASSDQKSWQAVCTWCKGIFTWFCTGNHTGVESCDFYCSVVVALTSANGLKKMWFYGLSTHLEAFRANTSMRMVFMVHQYLNLCHSLG